MEGVRGHLNEVRRKIAMLKGLEFELERMVSHCDHETVAKCRVIETLADHGKCRSHHGNSARSHAQD